MSWISIVLAAFQTLAQLSPSVAGMFHGGAGNTATKINSALQVASMFAAGTAAQLTAADVHPDLAAHAAVVETQHAAVADAASPGAAA